MSDLMKRLSEIQERHERDDVELSKAPATHTVSDHETMHQDCAELLRIIAEMEAECIELERKYEAAQDFADKAEIGYDTLMVKHIELERKHSELVAKLDEFANKLLEFSNEAKIENRHKEGDALGWCYWQLRVLLDDDDE